MATSVALQETITPQLLSEVRQFWFQHLKYEDSIAVPELSEMMPWFKRDPAFDKSCIDRFRGVLEDIKASGVIAGDILKHVDIKSPLDWLSLILLLDQIPRNSYRDAESHVVFNHYDPMAVEIALLAIKNGIPKDSSIQYCLAYRIWFYMPLMHSEELNVHDVAVRESRQMLKDVEELEPESPNLDQKTPLNDGSDYRARLSRRKSLAMTFCKYQLDSEVKHQRIIEQLGRYPHRNEALGRTATTAEKEYLENGGETFDGRRVETTVLGNGRDSGNDGSG